jgi:2-oxo-4-hydroxy-4-carboxy-5-ureidoimidazoline decarboxylase
MIHSSFSRRGFGRVALAGAALILAPFSEGCAQSSPMGDKKTIALADLNRMSAADFKAALSETFERGPWVAEIAYMQRPFATVTALHEAMFDALRNASHDKQLAFLGGGVDVLVTGKAAANITGQSKREQGSVGLDALSDADAAHFQQLNDAYAATFGFPFIIAVLRYTRDSIVAQLERRLGNEPATEFATALQEVFFISRIRLAALVTGEGMPEVNGLLDTHVLDTDSGGPAVGMAVELFEFSGERVRKISQSVTDARGRNGTPLMADRPLPIGRYELRFALGDYFAKRAKTLDDPPFLDIVSLRFSIAHPETQYHIPLLCSPWGYSTYKGD